jgi:hypothetical protein
MPSCRSSGEERVHCTRAAGQRRRGLGGTAIRAILMAGVRFWIGCRDRRKAPALWRGLFFLAQACRTERRRRCGSGIDLRGPNFQWVRCLLESPKWASVPQLPTPLQLASGGSLAGVHPRPTSRLTTGHSLQPPATPSTHTALAAALDLDEP